MTHDTGEYLSGDIKFSHDGRVGGGYRQGQDHRPSDQDGTVTPCGGTTTGPRLRRQEDRPSTVVGNDLSE